jgi:hypothetical protein
MDKHKVELDNPMIIGRLRPPLPRITAADTVRAIGRDAKGAVAGLIRSMSDADPEVRIQTMKALGEIGPNAAAAVPILVKQLKAPFVKKQAVETLGKLGRHARPAAPALAEVLKADVKKQEIGTIGWQALRAMDASVFAKAEADIMEMLRKPRNDD